MYEIHVYVCGFECECICICVLYNCCHPYQSKLVSRMRLTFRKRATIHMALLRKMTCKDKASHGSRELHVYRVANGMLHL